MTLPSSAPAASLIWRNLASVFEASHAPLTIELRAELLDELQLGFQKIDVLFFIDQKVVIKLLGDEIMG